MSFAVSEKTAFLGFITVVDHPRFGLVGGFLVLNLLGRPIEFHCTAPVKANRAQEILYGNTLKPYLFGEQIGQVLIRRCKAETAAILTDTTEILAVQDFLDFPVVFVPSVSEEAEWETESRQEQPDNILPLFQNRTAKHKFAPLKSVPGLSVARWKEANVAGSPIWIPEGLAKDFDAIAEQLAVWAKTVDYAEPFSRIRLALEEAQKAA